MCLWVFPAALGPSGKCIGKSDSQIVIARAWAVTKMNFNYINSNRHELTTQIDVSKTHSTKLMLIYVCLRTPSVKRLASCWMFCHCSHENFHLQWDSDREITKKCFCRWVFVLWRNFCVFHAFAVATCNYECIKWHKSSFSSTMRTNRLRCWWVVATSEINCGFDCLSWGAERASKRRNIPMVLCLGFNFFLSFCTIFKFLRVCVRFLQFSRVWDQFLKVRRVFSFTRAWMLS